MNRRHHLGLGPRGRASDRYNAPWRHGPQFPIELVAKDLALALSAAGNELLAPMLTAALGVFKQGVLKGLGTENMTAVAQLYSLE